MDTVRLLAEQREEGPTGEFSGSAVEKHVLCLNSAQCGCDDRNDDDDDDDDDGDACLMRVI
jgi:hypothetical protein